ncbi:MAG: hypothetical protein UHN47_03930 [Lachnospiraceae bacterium]|nr:hypothetical protein [Lachnospiraceae bacterium]
MICSYAQQTCAGCVQNIDAGVDLIVNAIYGVAGDTADGNGMRSGIQIYKITSDGRMKTTGSWGSGVAYIVN